ncbi:CLUMA_CG009677, isoform A [Clunio marinus]|uniref:CLUMA_CG009677, isoform A n=1 Tax=Clunio marinus TaxID=568069 RepID=A0A1J1I947_9DIPT|nr:CLUMA_CG009677, isoform A [Clunio marinus]
MALLTQKCVPSIGMMMVKEIDLMSAPCDVHYGMMMMCLNIRFSLLYYATRREIIKEFTTLEQSCKISNADII